MNSVKQRWLASRITELLQGEELDATIMPVLMHILINCYTVYRHAGRADIMLDSLRRFMTVIESGIYEDSAAMGGESGAPESEEDDQPLPGEHKQVPRKLH